MSSQKFTKTSLTYRYLSNKIFILYIEAKAVIELRSKEIRERSPIPIYGIGVIIILYSLIFPLYKLSHFIILAALCVAAFFILQRIFPGKTYTVEEPVTTGDDKIDALLREGDKAVKEMERLRGTIANNTVSGKIGSLIEITKKIFADLLDDPTDYREIKRFSEYFLPTTLKLLNAYDRFAAEEQGDNVKGTMEKIEDVLDATITAYHRQYDALFTNQALDIETDIEVLKQMMKREGLTDKDFD